MSLPYYISWTKQKDATTFEINRVDGAFFYTKDDREIIDMSSISYQAHFGYNHPKIIEKIKHQLDTIPISSPKGIYPKKNQSTQDLISYMGKKDGKIFYTTGGAETIENALKIARHITQKKLVLARSNSYHGATMGALSVTGDWRNSSHQLPNDWVVRIPEPNDIDAIKKTREIIISHGQNSFAAIIVETITGGNGVIVPTQEWWDGIQKICSEFNILGYMNYQIAPDMITLAKGITGGMVPFGALWTSKKISDFYENEILSNGLTNYAHPLGLAAMQGVLEIVHDKQFLSQLEDNCFLFQQLLLKFNQCKNVKEIRVKGLLCAIDLNKTIEWKSFFEAGIYLISQKNRIIIAPPLIIDEQTLKLAMEKILTILDEN